MHNKENPYHGIIFVPARRQFKVLVRKQHVGLFDTLSEAINARKVAIAQIRRLENE